MTDYSGVTVPGPSSPDDVPADLLVMRNGFDQRVLLRATSEADRDARYSLVEDGTMVVNTLDGTIWLRAGSAWQIIWAPTTDWTNISLGSTLQGPIQIRAAWIGGRKRAYFKGTMTKVDGTDISAVTMGGGSVIATVPASYIPTGNTNPTILLLGSVSLAGLQFAPVCRFQLDTTSGEIVVYGSQNPATGGTPYEATPWISFDSAEYWVDL